MTIRVRPIVLAFGLTVAFAAVVYGAWAYADGRFPFGPRDDEWTAVFLTNGNAYFGHFYSAPGEYAILRDVYYVLATDPRSQDPQRPAQAQFTLQRRGNEVHGPRAEMRLAKSQILFIEELRSDSPLVRAIAEQKAAPPVPVTQQPVVTIVPASPSASPSPSPARSPSPSPR